LAVAARRVKQVDNRGGEFVPDLRAHQSTILLQLHDDQQKSENGNTISCQRDPLYKSLFVHSLRAAGVIQGLNVQLTTNRKGLTR
jgi:hypothetical protein